MALRMDFIQRILGDADVAYSGLHKHQLREQVQQALDFGSLTVERIVDHLTRLEPGGKQHVFLLRPPRALNTEWRNVGQIRARLRSIPAARDVLDEAVPLLMPEELTLSSIVITDTSAEITAVEARHYVERAEQYDAATTTAEGLPVQLRAYVEHVARSTVRLRWDTATRHATLHITQATGRGIGTDHYADVAQRFQTRIAPFLDYSAFRTVDLYKVLYQLGQKEQTATPLTRSRRGAWDLPSGAEMTATSSSTDASVYDDPSVKSAISQVATPQTGRLGNLHWLPGGNGPLTDPLHINIIASDSRVHFMVPSTAEIVDHVIAQIRSLL